ncbi:DUF1702 family protein [Herpetosiphon giganteus]|uniref:DUF1702 family protein n=1 Tax=Herpetosiphon giganteus TaxID=2029754 RepID=UPI001957F8B3|nr:DUF1702 family protein [Herpetosiphon giganteus]MBM7845194.1 hypothetical protein [Herpetosiphon giganteus]
MRWSIVMKPFFNVSADAFQKMAGERYGYQADMDQTWRSFQPVAQTLVDAFYFTLDDSRFGPLVARLEAVDSDLRGIAYEGAGMGLMLLDSLFPWKHRLQRFIAGPGAAYSSLVAIGAGLVLPRVPKHPLKFINQFDPLLRWFVIDGYGFYEGFFNAQRTIERQYISDRLSGYAARAFDQGLGRSLWFATGANVERISAAIATFPAIRQPDLWSGIGLACAYAAGVVDRAAIESLQEIAGDNSAHMAVGVAIAATFRQHAGASASHTELACRVIWNRPLADVNQLAMAAQAELPADTIHLPAYEVWRQRIMTAFRTTPVTVMADHYREVMA